MFTAVVPERDWQWEFSQSPPNVASSSFSFSIGHLDRGKVTHPFNRENESNETYDSRLYLTVPLNGQMDGRTDGPIDGPTGGPAVVQIHSHMDLWPKTIQ